jgi:hypothetical protein
MIESAVYEAESGQRRLFFKNEFKRIKLEHAYHAAGL